MNRLRAGFLIALPATAVLAATGPLHAAERKPLPEPAPITGALPCAAYGPGFVAAPGGTTCARIGGSAAMAIAAGGGHGTGVRTGTGVRGTLELDTRTDTEQGPLRAFLRLRGAAGSADLDRR